MNDAEFRYQPGDVVSTITWGLDLGTVDHDDGRYVHVLWNWQVRDGRTDPLPGPANLLRLVSRSAA